jgi:uroporphyrinogen decarboxylase
MTGRELHTALYSGERFDRLPQHGVWPWAEALERWRREGLPADVYWNELLFAPIPDDSLGLPLSLNMVPAFEVRVFEKTDEFVTLVDEYGITKQTLRSDFDRSGGLMGNAGAMSSMSHWLDFPVKTLADWKPLYEERFRPDLAGRLPADWDQKKAEFREKSSTRWVSHFSFPLGGLFGGLRQLLGLEGLIFAMADDPALVRTMVDDLTTFWVETFARALRDVRLDQVTFFEDMCSTQGPLIGPATVREFLAPGYRKVIGALRDLGVREFWIDSDGNFAPLIPEMMACGITGTSPCEVQAGMDAGELRAAFPRLNLAGGLDKRALVQGPAAIENELRRRFATAWQKGRYSPSLDHGAPPDIPWKHVQHYAPIYRRYCYAPPG